MTHINRINRINRLPALQKLLVDSALDALLLTSPEARFYATGFFSSAGMVLVTRQAGSLFTDTRYIEAARNSVTGFDVEVITFQVGYKELVGAQLAEHGVKSLGFERRTLTVGQYEDLREAWPDVRFISAQKWLDQLRYVKSQGEIDQMRAAQRIAEAAFANLLPEIRPGLTERQILVALIHHLYTAGADGLAFDPIVASGPNGALPHSRAGDRPLREGDFLTLDFGAVSQSYCSDTTRTVALGYATEEMRRVYDTVLRAQEAGIAVAHAGVTGADIHNAALAVISEAGYGAYFGHGFGHCLGLEVHEPGGASPSDRAPLPVGAVLSAEPGIYLPGRFGVRIEDVIVITETGCENLTKLGHELMIL
ncbi:MAG: Xaa-Pro peptidase family protein [Oscillospiraceae bacterium]|nr:Xaa-Pro peptidase family protein [Oscillospiraceae bacterium]